MNASLVLVYNAPCVPRDEKVKDKVPTYEEPYDCAPYLDEGLELVHQIANHFQNRNECQTKLCIATCHQTYRLEPQMLS